MDFMLKMMDFVLKMMNFKFKMMNSVLGTITVQSTQARNALEQAGQLFDLLLKCLDFVLKMFDFAAVDEEGEVPVHVAAMVAFSIEIDEFCSNNDEFCSKTDEFCFKNDDLNAHGRRGPVVSAVD